MINLTHLGKCWLSNDESEGLVIVLGKPEYIIVRHCLRYSVNVSLTKHTLFLQPNKA